MAGSSSGLLSFLRQAEPRRAPSGWGLALDGSVAVAVAAGAVAEVAHHSTPDDVLAAATLAGLALAFRRVYPIAAWLTIVAAVLVAQQSAMPPVALGAGVLAAYSAVMHSRYQNLAIAAVLVVTSAATAAMAVVLLPQFPGRLTAVLAVAPAAAAAGLGIRELRRRLSESTARLRQAAAEHQATTRRAIEAERARIAGELHDVVTHNVSMMVVQAGAARAVLAGPPAAAGEAGQAARIKEAREAGNAARVKEAGEALLAVEASGRAALAELRNLLGLLSPVEADGSPAEAGGAALHPQPGLSELDALIGRVSAAGLPVQLHVSGTPRPLPPGADLAAYRVVQEALTNVLRHAGRAAASVMVHWGESVVITVSDDGDGAAAATDQAEESGQGTWAGGGGTLGRGLLGLRERLSLYGGELEAGPRPDGGWQLRAVMPAGHPA